MPRAFRICLCSILLLSGSSLEAKTAVREEFERVLWLIASRIHQLYFEDIDPDTLMHASARGLFNALDPASEYTFTGQDTSLGTKFYTLMKVAEAIDQYAFYPVTSDTLIRFGVAGMMEILDPYTVFLEKRSLANFNIQTQGHYGGLGFRIQVIYPDSAIAVWQLLHEDTPAARAGIKSGDLIIAIDDSTTKHMSAGDAADLMRGRPGTPVKLTIERAGREEPFDVPIVREEVQMRSVPYYTLFPDSTGYVKLTRFQQKSAREVGDALDDLLAQGMKRLIFDMRRNGGGYLQEAVEIADLFLPKDRLVVFTAGRAYKDTLKYFTKQKPRVNDEPLIVLVDRTSASASEIVAGAVQDWDRGLILGMPTVGKGSVQQTVNIDDKAELKLTMAAWHTPSGRSIDRRMRKDSTLVSDPDAVFKTRLLGRVVRGGGGITPDIHMLHRKGTPLFSQLNGYDYRGRYTLDIEFFHFARQYHLRPSDLTPSFRADEKTIEDFRDFLARQDFEYISNAEAPVKELEQKVAEEEDYKKLQKPLRRLLSEIDKIEEKHWEDNEELLWWKLTYDILEKNLGIQTAIAYDCTVDPQVNRAREILADPQEYEEWFKKAEIGVDEEKAIAQDIGGEDVQ